MASVRKLPNGRWQARYRAAPGGKQYTKTTARKVDAVRWLEERTSALVTGTHVDPKTARTTVRQWSDSWIEGYATRRGSTVRPSHVNAWTAKLRAEGYEPSYVYALHSRLSQVFADAVHDGIVPRSPCSRRTSPGQGSARPYVATTAQLWEIYGAFPSRYRVAVLLGAFVGLRTGEACGLRVADVDFMRGVVSPAVQYPAEELTTETSKTPVPIPHELALDLAAHVKAYPADALLTNHEGRQLPPWTLERAMRNARESVAGLPGEFRFHDLRHYYASLLISQGGDVKVVQARLRHASATTTLNTYAHLWPDVRRHDASRGRRGAVHASC